MKLTLKDVNFSAEEWEKGDRSRRIYPPPNDGREWMLLDEAAALYGIKPKTMANKMRRLNFTRTSRPGVKIWLVKKEVMDYLAFLKDRARWYKRHLPKCWKPMTDMNPGEEECFKRIFWTATQAAAFMGVNHCTIIAWGRKGKIPVFLTRKQGRGGKNWYSPTSLRNLKEDEEFLKRRAVWEKVKATMRTGAVGRETLKMKSKPMVYKNIPEGWLTIRQVAERLDVSTGAVAKMRQRGHLTGEHLTGEWDSPRRPWFFHASVVETYAADEDYQRRRRAGKRSIQIAIGNPDPDVIAATSPQMERNPDYVEYASGCAHRAKSADWDDSPFDVAKGYSYD